jgi:hypothetical protein
MLRRVARASMNVGENRINGATVPRHAQAFGEEREMGDELYTIPLPWIVFAVIARSATHGVVWASVAAIVTAGTLLVTRRRLSTTRNTLMIAAIGWFAGLGIIGLLHDGPTTWIARNGRTASALGFVVIALASLAFTPIAASYTRPLVKPSRWRSPRFEHVNVQLTLLWGVTFLGVAISHLCAVWLGNSSGTGGANTTFNWVVPIAMAAIAAHWSRRWFDDFLDSDTEHAPNESLWDLALAKDEREGRFTGF